jgi:hypothetical protein
VCTSYDWRHRFDLDGACICRCWECWEEDHGCICLECSGINHLACPGGQVHLYNYIRLVRKAKRNSRVNAFLFALRIFQ